MEGGGYKADHDATATTEVGVLEMLTGRGLLWGPLKVRDRQLGGALLRGIIKRSD